MVGQQNDRVLLVDDEPLIRKFISGYLVAAGYVVRVAVDGLDALEKLRTGLPDLVICDLKMPRMSGFEFLDVVRKRFPQIPVIVISADPADEMPEGLAADAHCQKNGFGCEQLLQTVSDLTRRLPLRAVPSDVDNKPAQARWGKDGNYLIGCEDCLREFSVLPASFNGRECKWIVCVHCRKVVQFLVPDGEPALPLLDSVRIDCKEH